MCLNIRCFPPKGGNIRAIDPKENNKINNIVREELLIDGDFSFIQSIFLRLALDYDYKYMFPQIRREDILNFNNFLNSDRNSFDQPRHNIWDTPPNDKWTRFFDIAYPAHNPGTFKYSMKTMNYIRKFGWNKYVIDYQTNRLPFKFK